jgi:hypothetical protein
MYSFLRQNSFWVKRKYRDRQRTLGSFSQTKNQQEQEFIILYPAGFNLLDYTEASIFLFVKKLQRLVINILALIQRYLAK